MTITTPSSIASCLVTGASVKTTKASPERAAIVD